MNQRSYWKRTKNQFQLWTDDHIKEESKEDENNGEDSKADKTTVSSDNKSKDNALIEG